MKRSGYLLLGCLLGALVAAGVAFARLGDGLTDDSGDPASARPTAETSPSRTATPQGSPTATSNPAAPDATFRSSVSPVSAQYRTRMTGVSWRAGCPVPIADLRLIRMSYWGFDGRVHRDGQLMVHRNAVEMTVGAFRELFEREFPIRRMQLIEEYAGSDDDSMAADNTSAFNCRPAVGSSEFSLHSYGRAIDVNPLENPYVQGSTVLPPKGADYLDRQRAAPGLIQPGPISRAFTSRGFTWGADWSSLKDYQHFEIPTGGPS